MSRKKKTNSEGKTAAQWLQDCLIHGEQPAKELINEGRDQGFAERTLRQAKLSIGAGSAKKDNEWYWFITTLAPIQAKPKEIKPTTDEFGYSVVAPRVIKTGNWGQCGNRMVKMIKQGIDDATIFNEIMKMAYPSCGLPESVIAASLRAHGVNVPNKVLDSTVQF